MPRRSTPSSIFGRLAISDNGEMPVTTRSGSRRQIGLQQASQRGSSGRVAGPSRTQSARVTRRSQVPPLRLESDDDDDDANGSDDDGSNAESDSEDVLTPDQVTPTLLRIMSAFDPAGLTPSELELSTGRQRSPHTWQLVNVFAQLIRSQDALRQLHNAVPIQGDFWSGRIAANLYLRFRNIQDNLRRNVANPTQGYGVIRTVDECTALYRTIDRFRQSYFQHIQPAQRSPFVALLVDILEFLSDNRDQFAGGPQRHYAGEGFQSHKRLLSSLLSEGGEAPTYLAILGGVDNSLLRDEHHRLRQVYEIHRGFYAVATLSGAGNQPSTLTDADRSRLSHVVMMLYNIVMRTQPPP